MKKEQKSFEQLVTENAGCLEFAFYGYIRMYEEGEEQCQCKDCIAIDKFRAAFDMIYTRVPIDMPFDIPKPTSIARIEHNAKYLENQQRLKNLADLDKSVTPTPVTVTTLKE